MNIYKIMNMDPKKSKYEALGFYIVLLIVNILVLVVTLSMSNNGVRLLMLPVILVFAIKPIIKMKNNRFLSVYL